MYFFQKQYFQSCRLSECQICLGQKHLHKLSHRKKSTQAQLLDQTYSKARFFCLFVCFTDTNDLFFHIEKKKKKTYSYKDRGQNIEVALLNRKSTLWNIFIFFAERFAATE